MCVSALDISPDDFVISSNGFKYKLGSQDYGFLGEFDEVEQALLALKGWCNINQYWPSLYFVNDHGNVDLIDYDGNIIDVDDDDD
jgi:hypothetical protein